MGIKTVYWKPVGLLPSLEETHLQKTISKQSQLFYQKDETLNFIPHNASHCIFLKMMAQNKTVLKSNGPLILPTNFRFRKYAHRFQARRTLKKRLNTGYFSESFQSSLIREIFYGERRLQIALLRTRLTQQRCFEASTKSLLFTPKHIQLMTRSECSRQMLLNRRFQKGTY